MQQDKPKDSLVLALIQLPLNEWLHMLAATTLEEPSTD